MNDLHARVGYLGLLCISALAIVAGVFPSILSLFALLSIPIAAAALVGLVSPGAVARSRWLKVLTRGGAIMLGLEAALLLGFLVLGARRPVVLALPAAPPARVRIVHDVSDGVTRGWRWSRRFTVPASGIVHARSSRDGGSYNPNDPHPVRAVIAEERRSAAPPITWIGAASASAGGCRVGYEEYVVGQVTPGDTAADAFAGRWLDSLDRWGVECRDGHLRRSNDGGAPLKRDGPACTWDRTGVMTCQATTGVTRP